MPVSFSLACGGDTPANDDAGPSADAAPTGCPNYVDFESLGQLTRIDIGYSGIAHGGNLPQGTYATYQLEDCEDDCRRCKFSGPVAPPESSRRPITFQRCLNDQRVECDSDDECGSGGKCRFQLRAVTTNGAGQCSGTYFEPLPASDPGPLGNRRPVQGTINLVTGGATFFIANLRSTVYAGGACQLCEGDSTPFDGLATGKCSVDTSLDCDVGGIDTPPNAGTSTSSFDCPLPGPLVADSPLPLRGLSSNSTTWTLDATRPECTGAGAEGTACWCGLCEDALTPCFEDSQCGGGTCGYAGTMEDPISTYNNLCDASCNYDADDDVGTCVSTALGGLTVPCFPRTGSITVSGGVEDGDGFFITSVSGLECFPATRTVRDAQFGLPGILYVKNVYRVTPFNSP